MSEKNERLKKTMAHSLPIKTSVLIITGLIASMQAAQASCDFGHSLSGGNVVCDTSIKITGGDYQSISAADGANDVTLDLNSLKVTGEGSLVDGSGYIYGGDGKNSLILHDVTASEVVAGGTGSTVDIYSGHYDRVVGGPGDSTINIHGNDAYIGSLSGDFYRDPASPNETQFYNSLNLYGVTDAIEKSPLAPTEDNPMQNLGLPAGIAGNGFEEIHLRDGSDLTLTNDVWTATEDASTSKPVLSVDNTSRLSVTGNRTVHGSFSNAGTLNLDNGTAANTLHLTGDYAGNNGNLIIGTKLNGDDSATDKLIVDGNTSGTTNVTVHNAGGSGAKTLNGIEVVAVGGQSGGEFVQNGRITAGAYDYTLARGAGADASNWYLTSQDAVPVTPVTPDGPTPTAENNVRPEAAAYGANMAAANTLFTTTLHDRLGETHYVDAAGHDQVTSLWLRNVGGHNRSSDSSGQNKTQANRYVVQLGGDIASWSSDGANRYHLGVMGGYANQHGNTRNSHTGYSADSSTDGYSAGLYGTWFQDNEEKTGAYVDTWMLYNWFDNSVSGDDSPSENYKSKGITASVETGYAWKLANLSERNAWYIQPQAQLTWMGVQADDLRAHDGTKVTSEGDNNLQSRLGVRTYLKGHNAIDDNAGRTFEPFVEANWLHNTHSFGASLDGVRIDQAGARNIGELKAGVEAKLSQTVNLWGSVGQQMGDKGYSDTQATLGLKMNF